MSEASILDYYTIVRWCKLKVMFDGPLSIIAFAVIIIALGGAVVGATTQFVVTHLTLKRMSAEQRDLFQQGWVLPKHIKLYGLKSLEDAYYPIFHNGKLELAYHLKGVWSIDVNEPPLEGPLYVYQPRRSSIYAPKP